MAIIKILARHNPSFGSLMQYVTRYVVDENKSDSPHIYKNNLSSNDLNGLVSEFIKNEAFRKHTRSDQVHLFHEIVSFHADEDKANITPEIVDDLAQAYMRLRGITGVMLGAAHYDKSHVHLHFCVSALHFRTGKSFGLNKTQMHELKQSFQQYHKDKYPELTKSFPVHGKGERYMSHSEWHGKQREQIVDVVRQCFAEAKTQNEFLDFLRNQNLHYYERNGKPTGIVYDGLKFRFSRLLESKQLDSLPIEKTEEDRILAEIKALRERQIEHDKRARDLEDRER